MTATTTTFSSVLRRFRLEQRVSQAWLAQAIGYDHSTLSRLESGERNPTSQTVAKVSDALLLSDDERDELYAAAGLWPAGWDFSDVQFMIRIAALLKWRGVKS